ncbi:MAG: hypothetical protein DRO15_04725 [Thermoprotei archaeon]|nr:MAG: hypothetical protein DRO15_04725 [Thermoprotei archaeon]
MKDLSSILINELLREELQKVSRENITKLLNTFSEALIWCSEGNKLDMCMEYLKLVLRISRIMSFIRFSKIIESKNIPSNSFDTDILNTMSSIMNKVYRVFCCLPIDDFLNVAVEIRKPFKDNIIMNIPGFVTFIPFKKALLFEAIGLVKILEIPLPLKLRKIFEPTQQ